MKIWHIFKLTNRLYGLTSFYFHLTWYSKPVYRVSFTIVFFVTLSLILLLLRYFFIWINRRSHIPASKTSCHMANVLCCSLKLFAKNKEEKHNKKCLRKLFVREVRLMCMCCAWLSFTLTLPLALYNANMLALGNWLNIPKIWQPRFLHDESRP